MTTALEGGEWSAAGPGRNLPPRKTRYQLYRRLGGPQGQSGRAEKFGPQEFDPGHYEIYLQNVRVKCKLLLSNMSSRLNLGYGGEGISEVAG